MSTISLWTQKIRSDSRVLDPLGLGYHLNIQRDFVPAITSVTKRMRYYTMQAWFFKNRSPKEDPKRLERLFILATLNHHNGDHTHPSIRHIFNKEKFKTNWNDMDSFSLEKDFKISGFGRTYYVSQLEIFRCAWFDFRPVTTPLNDKLASTIQIDPKPLESGKVTKDELQKFAKMCICDSETNQNEIDIFSKILFGFIRYTQPEDLDDESLVKYANGGLDLEFVGKPDISLDQLHRERNMRRRNTLFMYMKIIEKTSPDSNRIDEFIWDAVYFKQDTITKKTLDFGRLERIRTYWEVHQYLIYYVFAIESVLDVVQLVMRKNPHGVKRADLIKTLDKAEIFSVINQETDNTSNSITIDELKSKILAKNQNRVSDLNSALNESVLFDKINDSETKEEMLVYCLLLLVVLRIRFDRIPKDILEQAVVPDSTDLIFDSLHIARFVKDFDANSGTDVLNYLEDLLNKTITKHLYESAKRYHQKTRNWIFAEENGFLFPSGRKEVNIKDRNNRWNSIYNLLKDTKMIEEQNERVILTTKGKIWLKMTD